MTCILSAKKKKNKFDFWAANLRLQWIKGKSTPETTEKEVSTYGESQSIFHSPQKKTAIFCWLAGDFPFTVYISIYSKK